MNVFGGVPFLMLLLAGCATSDGGSGGVGNPGESSAIQNNQGAVIGGSATNIAGAGSGVGGAGGSGGSATNTISPQIALDAAAFDAIFGTDRDTAAPDASTIAQVGTALGADAQSEAFRDCANNMANCVIASE